MDAGKTITTERINPFPTAIAFGAGKADTYCNKVAPTARIYLHLICRKRFFRGASALIPIRFLRQPDRWVPTKPLQAERINPFPTIMDFGTGKTIANGRAMLAPTGCGKKTQIRTNVARGKYGFVGSFDTGTPEIYVSVGDLMRL